MASMIIIKGPNGIREVKAGVPYRLEVGEKIAGSYKTRINGVEIDEVTTVAKSSAIGAGDLIAAITGSTGFKRWWHEKHRGECMPCKRRQATANYLRAQGPAWLKTWVDKNKEKDESPTGSDTNNSSNG